VRRAVGGEGVDDGARLRDLGERVVRDRDRGSVARDGDDVVEGRGAEANLDRVRLEHGLSGSGPRVLRHGVQLNPSQI
jgi:hypothetical protein